jgi:ABC-2 type transport system permease protein
MKNHLRNIKNEIIAVLVVIKTNISSSTALRSSFLLQMFGMAINNGAFLISWVLFSQAFGEINGWGTTEIIGLQGIIAFVYGISNVFAYGSLQLSQKVHKGILDNYLLLPKSVYFRIIFSDLKLSAFGDVLEGLILIPLFLFQVQASIEQIILILLFLFTGIVIFINFGLFASSLSLFIPDSESLTNSLIETIILPALLPGGVFQGFLRFFFLFIIPALFVSSIPIETLKDTDWKMLGLSALFALFWIFISNTFLRLGLKRYESTNLIGARV